MATLLVTGARGAIGQHVVSRARARGDRVVGIGHGAWTGDVDLPEIDGWINGGVDADNLSAIARSHGAPDAVIHLAGGSLVGASIEHPGEDFRRTVGSAQALLEWLRTNAPDARLVVASSAAIYGNGHVGPIPEDAAHAPTSPYGTHKAMVEMMASAYARQYGLAIAIVRLFSVYGPALRKQLIFELAGRLLRGERDIVLGGTGEEQRDFLHIGDASSMLIDAAALADATAPVCNGCSGRAVKTREIAGMIAAPFQGARVRFSGAARKGDPVALVGDATRARACGLAATMPLDVGLASTISWIDMSRGGNARGDEARGR